MVFGMSHVLHTGNKNDKRLLPGSFEKNFSCRACKFSSWASPRSILYRFGTLQGVSWAILGRSWHPWAVLGRSWPPLGHFLDDSWMLLGAIWGPNAVQDGFKIDFGSILARFWLYFGGSELGFEGFAKNVTNS